MNTKLSSKKYLAMLLFVAVAVGTFAGVARSLDDPNTFHACGRSGTGALRKVDDPSLCKSSEEPLKWNVTGPQGAPGISGYEIVQARHTDVAGAGLWVRRATCGIKSVLGGGYFVNDGNAAPSFVVTDSRPDQNTWVVGVFDPEGDLSEITVYALCANVSA